MAKASWLDRKVLNGYFLTGDNQEVRTQEVLSKKSKSFTDMALSLRSEYEGDIKYLKKILDDPSKTHCIESALRSYEGYLEAIKRVDSYLKSE